MGSPVSESWIKPVIWENRGKVKKIKRRIFFKFIDSSLRWYYPDQV
jgi:hypothetical protein